MNNSIKKGVVVAVILLFIGLAFAPSINANISKSSIDSELVEFTTEICGLNGGKHTVQLTNEEADKLEQLFDVIKKKLDEVETREQSVEILNDAIVTLDKYNLLGGLSIEQARRLILGEFYSSFSSIYNYESNENTVNNNGENFNCLIAGRSTSIRLFFGRPTVLGRISEILLSDEFLHYMDWLQITFPLFYRFVILPPLMLILLPTMFIAFFIPSLYDSRTNGTMTFGNTFHIHESNDVNSPSKGWVWTDGLNGVIKWEEPVYGQIKTLYGEWDVMYYDYYVGAVDFKGIKLSFYGLSKYTYYVGYASHVALGPSYY